MMLKEFIKINYAGWRHSHQQPRRAVYNEKVNELNESLKGYPHNHNYQIHGDMLVPCWRLFKRLKAIAPLYPDRLDSLLDVSSCKGYYVCDAALHHKNCRALGIDVCDNFVSLSSQVKHLLGIDNAAFAHATLDDLLEHPDAYQPPFPLILFLGSYHYFYWGSTLNDRAYHDHYEILHRIARLCSNRVIFSARLEIDRLPRYLQNIAREHEAGRNYNTAAFLDAARSCLSVKDMGLLGRDNLYLLTRKDIDG